MFFAVLLLAPIWLVQTALAVSCWKKYPGTRIPAFVLMVVSPLPVVAALFGESFFGAVHAPSSFDAIGDGFEILFRCVALLIGTGLLAGAVCVWLSFNIGTPTHRRT